MNNRSPRFSIFIPTWNNLSYLKLCIESIRKNSVFEHQILVYVNDGHDGSLEYVKQLGIDFIHSEYNVGICIAVNSLRTLVTEKYIVYANDDMYFLPGWDSALWNEIQALPNDMFFLSSTMFWPSSGNNSYILRDYGDSIETFREEQLLKEYKDIVHPDLFGATTPPNIVSVRLWDIVGGYSIEFSPGMYSDPDFSAKLWMAGVRYFKTVSASRVYHFGTKSTERIKKNPGQNQFLNKYDITSSTFRKYITLRDKEFSADNVGKIDFKGLKLGVWKSKLKKIFSIFKSGLAKPLWKL